MFGPGIYVAQHASKSDEYTKPGSADIFKDSHAMLICRAAVGHALKVTDPADYSSAITSGAFDSVFGDREQAVGTYPELVFFDEQAICPTHVVIYSRVYEGDEDTR